MTSRFLNLPRAVRRPALLLVVTILGFARDARATNLQVGYAFPEATLFSNETAPPLPTGWLIIDLGAGRMPVDVNNNGTVLFSETAPDGRTVYYRRKRFDLYHGLEEPLNPTAEFPSPYIRGLNNRDDAWGTLFTSNQIFSRAAWWPAGTSIPQLWCSGDPSEVTEALFYSDNRRMWIKQTLRGSAPETAIFTSIKPGERDELLTRYTPEGGDDMAVDDVANSGDMVGFYYKRDATAFYDFVGSNPHQAQILGLTLWDNLGPKLNERGLALLPEYVAISQDGNGPLYLWDAAAPRTFRRIGIARNTLPGGLAPARLGISTRQNDQDALVIVNGLDLFIEAVDTESPTIALNKYPAWALFPRPAGWNKIEVLSVSPNAKYILAVGEQMTPPFLRHGFLAVRLEGVGLWADANRDGLIDPDDPADATDYRAPYRFWVNDDDDSGDLGGDDIPGQPEDTAEKGADYFTYDATSTGNVDGVRDLTDFFPVFLDVAPLLAVLPPGDSIKYKLVQADAALNFVYSNLPPERALDYQTHTLEDGFGEFFHQAPGSARTLKITAEGVELSDTFLDRVQDGSGGVLLLEARKPSIEPLRLVVEKDGLPIAELDLPLSISPVEKMFRHANLCFAAGEETTVVSRATAPNWPDSLTNGNNFVFVHGYNVNQQAARGWAADMFKKMWWSGSRAKFYAVTWRGSDTQLAGKVTVNYHINVEHAFATAPAFAQFVNSLEGETTVAAHSLGNMVVLAALNLPEYAARISRLFALDAAVAAETVDADLAFRPGMAHSDWDSGTTDNPDPAKIDESLWASEWHLLFPPDDARSRLTWRNLFAQFNGAAVYNFYSAGAAPPDYGRGEEVLNYTETKPTHSVLGSLEIIIGISDAPTGELAWWSQELFKGRYAFDGLIGSDYGGWGFGSDYWQLVQIISPNGQILSQSRPPTREEIAAYDWTDERKRTAPLFLAGTRKLIGPAEEPVSKLYGPNGSGFAERFRIKLLADMIPARTLAIGREAIPSLNTANEARNFDLSSSDFQDGWPLDRLNNIKRRRRWLHSDGREVAYKFNHGLFDRWVILGHLRTP